MKSKLLLFLFASALACPAFAQKAVTAEDRPKVVVTRQVHPVFPRSMLELGVTQGEARIVISIDSTGQLVEMLAIGYTHPTFAEVSMNALKKWEFEPPVWHGEKVSVQREMRFEFEGRGVVVSMDVGSYVASRAFSVFADSYVYRPVTLRELDRIPTPLAAEAPLYPQSLAEKKRGAAATVEFFIDEEGDVRMPSVVQSDDPEAAITSVMAVRDWKFEPPTRNGKPVLVKVQQTFRFHAN